MKNACYNKIMFKKAGGLICGAVALSVGVFTMMSASAIEYNTDFVVDIDPDTTLTVPSSPVVLSLAPTPGGAFDSASFDVYASTNSKHGYVLTMEVKKTYLEGSYANADTGITPKIHAIPFVEGGISENDFSGSSSSDILNHWGISIDNNTSYNPIGNKVLKTTSSASSNDRTTFNVAAKVNADSATGAYSTTINFTLVPNVDNTPVGVSGGSPNDPSGGEGIGAEPNTLERLMEIHYYDIVHPIYVLDETTGSYHEQKEGENVTGKKRYFAMQHMTPQVCAKAKVGSEMKMMDLRDGKVYWVAKLKDGKCWMTQNLDLNLSSNKTLTPRDTDIPSNWKPSLDTLDYDGRTEYHNNMSGYGWMKTEERPYSIDPGNWYWIGTWDRNGVSTWYSHKSESYIQGYGLNDDPPHWQLNEPYSEPGEHTHVGNYYNYAAAIGIDSSSSLGKNYQEMDRSICPAGWRLPKFGDSYDSDTNDMYGLVNAYGWSKNASTVSGATDKVLTGAPFWFVRAGYFYSYPTEPGERAEIWTSTISGSGTSYSITIADSGWLTGQTTFDRGNGLPVRCIAR